MTKVGTWGNKELDMAVWLFAAVSFAVFVCARSTYDSAHLGLCCKSLKNFSLYLSLPQRKK